MSTKAEIVPRKWNGSILDPSDPERKRVLFNFIPKKLDDGGIVIAANAGVKLSLAEKHLVTFRAGQDDAWFISADGFRHANRVAGVNVVFPPEMRVPGVDGPVPNPYVDPSRKRGHFRGFCRAIGIYKNLMGEVMILDRPMDLDLEAYLLEDFAAKEGRFPSAITWGSADVNPADCIISSLEARNITSLEKAERWENSAQGKKAGKPGYARQDILDDDAIVAIEEKVRAGVAKRLWKFFPLLEDDTGGVGLWVDLTAEPVRRVLRTLLGKWKFGSRILATIAYRNVMRDALGIYSLDPRRIHVQRGEGRGNQLGPVLDASTVIPVSVFRTEWDEKRVQQLMKDYVSGIRTAELSGAVVDIKRIDHEPMDPELHSSGGSLQAESVDVRHSFKIQQAEPVDEPEDETVQLGDRPKLLLSIQAAEKSLRELGVGGLDAVDAAQQKVFGDTLLDFASEEETPVDKLATYLRSLKARAARLRGQESGEEKPKDVDASGDEDLNLEEPPF